MDAGGAPIPGLLPFEAGCARRHPQGQDTPLAYRRHDWPAAARAARLPLGYQASDAVLGTLLGRPAAIHTFDFGDAARIGDTVRRFGTFDAGAGDGGQVVPLGGDAAYVAMTEDGSGGVQWFLSPDCGSGGRGWSGWLLAAAEAAGSGADSWAERVVRLRRAPTAEACPTAFDLSLTRWRRARLALPWREAATGATGSATVDAIVSEHYGSASIARASHLERFWLARDLGMVRWERWENTAVSRRPDIAGRARLIAESGRCPEIAFAEPPAAGWARTDCRTWTNFVRARPGEAALIALPWPPPALR